MNRLRHGLNQMDIQDMNRSLLLNLMRKEGVCARAELAKISGLKQATVTNIVNDFIAWRLVKETGFLAGSKGRRSIGISINNDEFGVIGVQLARTHYDVGLFNLSGERIRHTRHDKETACSPRQVMDEIIQLIKRTIEESGERKILAMGIAVPGPYSIKSGRIELMTGFQGWNDIAIQKEIEDTIHLPFFLEQDANAGALSQYWYDSESYKNDTFAYITDGQGVGAGIVINGELLRGAQGTAGKIGHMSINFNGPRCSCGNYGCLENYCSSIAFTREVNRVLDSQRQYNFSDAKKMICDGRTDVMDIFFSCCDKLAIGIVNLINVFNPSVIVIGDEMAHVMPELMIERLKQKVQEKVLPELYESVTIRMSAIEDSMLTGAAIVAIKNIFKKPEEYFVD